MVIWVFGQAAGGPLRRPDVIFTFQQKNFKFASVHPEKSDASMKMVGIAHQASGHPAFIRTSFS